MATAPRDDNHPLRREMARWAISILALSLLAPLVNVGAAGASWVPGARVWLCARTLAARPHTIVIACADANTEVTDLRWTSWGEASAVASGRYVWNDCTPNCAAGHFHSRAVDVRLYGLDDGVYRFMAGVHDSLGGASPVGLLAPSIRGSWHASVSVGAAAHCPGGTVAGQMCQLKLPTTRTRGVREEFTVTLHNSTDAKWCLGVSFSSSVAAGLRSLCAGAHRVSYYDVIDTTAVDSGASVSIFVVAANQVGPLRPTHVANSFGVTLSARWWD
jgi:hypothetical protein